MQYDIYLPTWEFKSEFHNTEKVYVGIVDGEVNGDQSCASLKPSIGFELSEQCLCDILLKMEVLDIASTLVGCKFALE